MYEIKLIRSVLEEGAMVKVSVLGRLRNNRFTDFNGVERTVTEIIANKVRKIEE